MNSKKTELAIRVFGSKECLHCKKLMQELGLIGVPYSFIDANEDKNQDLCDKNNVDRLPHAQCLDKVSGSIIFEYVGPISAQNFMDKISQKITGKSDSTFKGKSICKNCNRKKDV